MKALVFLVVVGFLATAESAPAPDPSGLYVQQTFPPLTCYLKPNCQGRATNPGVPCCGPGRGISYRDSFSQQCYACYSSHVQQQQASHCFTELDCKGTTINLPPLIPCCGPGRGVSELIFLNPFIPVPVCRSCFKENLFGQLY